MAEIDPLVWHMLDWELHALRGLVTTCIAEVQLAARELPEDSAVHDLAERVGALTATLHTAQQEEMRAALVRDIFHESQAPVVPTSSVTAPP